MMHFTPVTLNQHPEIFFLLFFSPLFLWLIPFLPVSFSLSHMSWCIICVIASLCKWGKLWWQFQFGRNSEHIVIWHEFLIATALMCWEACPDCPLLILMDLWVDVHAVACSATMRLTHLFSSILMHTAQSVSQRKLKINYGHKVAWLSTVCMWHYRWLLDTLDVIYCIIVA